MSEPERSDPKITVRFSTADRDLPAAVGDTLLQVAMREGVELDHACGGVCACSTCHVKITAGADALSPSTDDEEDQLDTARDLGLGSRLGCQARIVRAPKGGVVAATIPSWNVNVVREGH